MLFSPTFYAPTTICIVSLCYIPFLVFFLFLNVPLFYSPTSFKFSSLQLLFLPLPLMLSSTTICVFPAVMLLSSSFFLLNVPLFYFLQHHLNFLTSHLCLSLPLMPSSNTICVFPSVYSFPHYFFPNVPLFWPTHHHLKFKSFLIRVIKRRATRSVLHHLDLIVIQHDAFASPIHAGPSAQRAFSGASPQLFLSCG